ncbi:MAG: hypothetical protein OXJ52_04055 [Oligoflexia bacterium]|nr:hypothetical protein [Oligoflexia bacterium]
MKMQISARFPPPLSRGHAFAGMTKATGNLNRIAIYHRRDCEKY